MPAKGLQKEAQAEIKSPAGTPRGKVEGLNHNIILFRTTSISRICKLMVILFFFFSQILFLKEERQLCPAVFEHPGFPVPL